jgi:hypothetical protein
MPTLLGLNGQASLILNVGAVGPYDWIRIGKEVVTSIIIVCLNRQDSSRRKLFDLNIDIIQDESF